MRRIIDLTVEQDKSIERLIRASKYEDYQHFMSAAIDNQLALEAHDSGSAVGSNRDQLSVGTGTGSPGRGDHSIISDDIESVAPLAPTDVNEGDNPNSWLWGQVNSVLAIKFAVRECARLTSSRPSITLQELATEIAASAARFRPHLERLDLAYGHGRGERLATSFPSSEEKSLSRFAGQYIGAQRRDDRYDGALFQVGLLGMTDDGRPRLTSRGADFALLSNPVIDDGDPGRGRWLSEDEQRFYIVHVSTTFTVERNPLRWALNAVRAGANDRTSMNADLSRLRRNWSPAEVETYRVGTVSRLVQLGTLQVTKNGRGFQYELGSNADLATRILEDSHPS